MATTTASTYYNNTSAIVTGGGTDAPASGTTENWTVGSAVGFPSSLNVGVSQIHIADVVAPTEKIAVNSISSGVWGVTRGAENTTPVTHQANFVIEQVVTAGDLDAMNNVSWLNVVTQFGADPTGNSDSTTAIQNALSAAPTGGVVYLPGGGTFLVSGTLTVPNDVTLLGDPASDFLGGSIINVANGANLNTVISDSVWASNGTVVSNAPRVQNIIINANGANQSSGTGIGIAMSAYRGEVVGCRIEDTRGDGIRMTDMTANGHTIPTASCVENKILDNTVESPGLAALSGNKEGIAMRDSGNGAVTDWWITRNVIYSGSGTVGTGGVGIYGNSATGCIISDNHSYGTGTHGIQAIGTSLRITNNYVEYFGQYPSSGNVYGIYAVDNGGGPGTYVAGNVVNVDDAITGNTFSCFYITNPGSNQESNIALGPNCMTTSVAAATAVQINDQGNADDFKVVMDPQLQTGFTTPYSISSSATILGTPYAGWQQPTLAATMSTDLSKGSDVEIGPMTANVTMNIPTNFYPGLTFTYTFQQNGTGGYTVNWNNNNLSAGEWNSPIFQPSPAANAVSAVSFVSDGYNLTQVGYSQPVWTNTPGYGGGWTNSTSGVNGAYFSFLPNACVQVYIDVKTTNATPTTTICTIPTAFVPTVAAAVLGIAQNAGSDIWVVAVQTGGVLQVSGIPGTSAVRYIGNFIYPLGGV
jgi:hypothetical protein